MPSLTAKGQKISARHAENALIRELMARAYDPLEYALFNWRWDELDSAGPWKWQASILNAIREHLNNPLTIYQPLQIAVASGKGIGKSALLGMLTNWAMSTCAGCRVRLTANTEPQLKTITWPEVSKWFAGALNSHWFDVEQESIRIVEEKGKEATNLRNTWRCDRMTWNEKKPEAFGGLHNRGKRILVIFDEASGIPDSIWDQTQSTLTDENTEIIWLVFGNPMRNTGKFHECFGKNRNRWLTFQIDSREVEGTNKEKIQQDIEEAGGEESDWAKIYVRGMFPSKSSKQLISSEIVAAAMKYRAESYDHMPKVLSVDVARYGNNKTVIGTRQGRKGTILAKLKDLDTVQTAERVIEFINAENPDGTVVDADGLGAGVVDQIRARNYKVFEFHGAHRANEPEKYFNRRAEVWCELRDWLKEGAEIPFDRELEADLTGPEYLIALKGQIQLEKKEEMERRGLSSPDTADMFAMTFGITLAAKYKPVKNEYADFPQEPSLAWMGT